MKSLGDLKEILLHNSSCDERKIIGLWTTDCLYNPSNNGRIFQYKYLIVQTKFGQGCAYSINTTYNVNELSKLIGEDCLSEVITDGALQVACLDALSNKLNFNYCSETIELQGKSEYKLCMRSSLIVAEAKRMIGDLKGKRILNVGVVGDIIKSFIEEECEIAGTDFDDNIIGSKLFDKVSIYSGKYTTSLIKDADIAIVTGMTITTNSLDEIIRACKMFGVKLIIFAETGANMGQYYVKHGADVYIGEKYPFYIFDGKSTIEITRKTI